MVRFCGRVLVPGVRNKIYLVTNFVQVFWLISEFLVD